LDLAADITLRLQNVDNDAAALKHRARYKL
jgi:hypothetical protein